MLRLLLIVLPVAVIVYALVDAITSPKARVRTLPKFAWILIILFVVLIGAICWFIFGRPRSDTSIIDRWGLGGAGGNRNIRPSGPDDDPDFLRDIERRKPKSDTDS